jgi:hypothetical protein
MITFKYKLTEQEYRDFCLYTGWLSPDKKGERIKYYATMLFIYFGVIGFVFLISGKFRFSTPGIILIVIIGILSYYYLRYRMISHYDGYVKKVIKESGEDKILTTAHLTFSESGILEQANSTETKYNWSAIIKKAEVNNCYYLYTTSLHAIVLPNRVFSTSEEKGRFEKILLQHIPPQAEWFDLKR